MSLRDPSSSEGNWPADPARADPGQGAPDDRPGSPADGAGDGGIARLFEMTSDLLATISPDGRFTLLNPAWEKVLGWTREELRAETIEKFLHPDDLEETREAMRAHESAGEQTFTNRYRHRDGEWRWLLWSASRDGDTWYAAAKDVTDRMQLENQAVHDPLTKLPNRLLLLDRAKQAIARLDRSDGVVAMLFIDLDKFKAVNDTLGHEVGDELLVAISGRLADLMRDTDTVARLGGDEFVILAVDLESEAEALALGERVVEAIEQPVALTSTEVPMGGSVGISVAVDPSTDPETVLREADVAMYRAKAAGGSRPKIFDEHMRSELNTNTQIELQLRNALPQDELTLLYQPIVPLAGGQAIGCEALIRWRAREVEHVDDQELLPSTFLPPAEESELIVQIGNWVLRSACAQADRWRRNGIALPVHVNVSPRELTELDLAGQDRRAAGTQSPPRTGPVPGGQRGLHPARPRARPRLPAGGQAARGDDRARPLRLGQVLPRASPQPAPRRRQARPGAGRELPHQPGEAGDLRRHHRARQGGQPEGDRGGHRNTPPAGPGPGARLHHRPGLPAAQAGRPRAPAPQAHRTEGNVRGAMADDGAAGRLSSPPNEDPIIFEQKRAAARAAAELIRDGMRLGLGTGTTVAHLLPAVAELDCRELLCVATSPATEAAALSLGLTVLPLDSLPELDLAIDGADQVDPSAWLVKGGGGAHTREKIVAAAASRFVVIVSADKAVPALHSPVPLELVPFGVEHTLAALAPSRLRDGPTDPRRRGPRGLPRPAGGSPGAVGAPRAPPRGWWSTACSDRRWSARS